MNSRLFETECAQEESEIAAFCELVRAEGASSYLEIGAKFGGSLWRVAQALKLNSRIVAVDLPRGTRLWSQSEQSLKSCAEELRSQGHTVNLIWGDSTSQITIGRVTALGPFDVVFIDANHTMPYLRQDAAHYGKLGKMVAFHDIAWYRPPDWDGVRIDAPEFWNEIKNDYRHQEIKFDLKQKDFGIGVIWR